MIILKSILWFILFLYNVNTVSSKDIKVIAHRGASAYAPENTISAFKKAFELGVDILEIDVHQTNDRELVVLHDGTVNRTTNGKGKVKNISFEELRKLDAGSWFSNDFIGEKIPSLREVFEITPDSIILLIEIKKGSKTYPGVEKRVVQLIKEYKFENRVILKSFDDKTLQELKNLAPEIPRLKVFVGQISFLNIVVDYTLNFGNVLDDDVQYIQAHWFGVTKCFIAKAHKKGYKVYVWDVNNEKRMKELILMGVDGIETDYPDLLKKVRAEIFVSDVK